MAVVWRGTAALLAAKEEMAKRLLRAIVLLTGQQQTRVGISNPRPHKTPSLPGEYPRKRTGFGQAGVVSWPQSVRDVIEAGLKVKAGELQSAFYMLVLEVSKKRLGFKKTLDDMLPLLKTILESKA